MAVASDVVSDDDHTSTLEDILEELVINDPDIIGMRSAETLSAADVMDHARALLSEGAFDAFTKLEEVKRAEQQRDRLLAEPNPWYVTTAYILVGSGSLGLLVLLAVSIAKWTGHLLKWPLWPFIAVPVAFEIVGLSILLIRFVRYDLGPIRSATIAVETSRTSLKTLLRSLVIIPAITRATSLNLVPPSTDDVYLTDAPGLSSRIESGKRIETQSYREVVTNLAREGGVTLGLAGSRGAGKSELLRAFCDDPSAPPSIKAGGVIGISLPAPVAYESQPFLRVLIRRLAEAVPGYDASMLNRPTSPSIATNIIALIFSAIILLSGVALLTKVNRHVSGWALVVVGALGLVVLTIRLIPQPYRKTSLNIALSVLGVQFSLADIVSIALPILGYPQQKADSELRGKQINQEARQALALKAGEVARRVRYVETRSASLESSASWHNTGLKHTAGLSLAQVPLTEPDLVLELADLVESLHDVGYQVMIGIDELDKLDDAASFLTGIKALFAIRDCSFILTISENSFSQFARRGMPVRDVFDSSLDAVAIVQPLTLVESRRLVRARLSADYSDKVSDTQILLCYCLAGGIPREFLRFCRQLGTINSKIGGNSKLSQVMDLLLRAEVVSRITGIQFALQGREEKDAATIFMAQLETIHTAVIGNEVFGQLGSFLSRDHSFAELCVEGTSVSVQDEPSASNDGDWIRDSRRQLFTYLYFVETVRSVLNLLDQKGGVNRDSANELVDAYEVLADARRRLEMDAAAGWRRTTVARRAFGLVELPVLENNPMTRSLVGGITRSLQRALKTVAGSDGAL